MKFVKFIIVQVCFCILSNSAGAQEQTPFQITRYQKVFPTLVKLSDKVWGQNVPYNDMPVLAYDMETQEEFLINYSTTPPDDYKITAFTVNSKPVYKKIGKLTLNFPAAQCCRLIGNAPVITMGYGKNDPPESILQTMLHEGFHYYQNASLYTFGVEDVPGQFKKILLTEIPRTLDYDKKLVIEAKLLFDMTKDDAKPEISSEQLKQLAAVEILRKKQLPADVSMGEDSELLLEGTAVCTELQGLKTLAEGNIDTRLSTTTLKMLYQQYLQHYGPAILNNQINLTTIADGELVYRYALAFARVLDKTGLAWKRGLFPLLTDTNLTKEKSKSKVMEHLRKHSFSNMLVTAAKISESQAKAMSSELEKDFLSPSEIRTMKQKIRIEENLDNFPFEDGWTYKVEAGQFLYTYFNYPTGKRYSGKKGNAAYLSGLLKLESVDKRLLVENTLTQNIAIPVVSKMFSGDIRFKDIGRDFKEAVIVCENKSNDTCETLSLQINGLKLTAKKVSLVTDETKKETVIKLLD